MKINKTLPALMVCSLLASTSFAQKAKVVSAYNYNKSYERDKECSELVKGIEAIEPATKDEKTAPWAKTWYYGGNLWFNAAFAQDKECADKFENALDNSFEYYMKALKYNIDDPAAKDLDLEKDADAMKFMGFLMNRDTKFEDPMYLNDIFGNKFPFLANAFVNKGVEEFQAKNYEKSMEYSQKSIITNMFLGRVDSLGIYNSALAAEKLGMDDEAVALYTQLTQIGYGGADMYLYIANIYDKKNDTTKKIEAIRKGLEAYPDDANLIREELSYLLVTGQTDEALANFDKAIEKDPKNPSLYYNRGLIFDQLGKQEEAAVDYNKALEVDPTFFDAAYNLGAMYYNMGVEWNNKASSYGLNETAKYKEATGKANELFAKAQPALEKAHEIDSSDQSTMASLVKIYAIVGEDAKYASMKKKLEESQK
jgi:tetratricopeptide (TPR) repeat protein